MSVGKSQFSANRPRLVSQVGCNLALSTSRGQFTKFQSKESMNLSSIECLPYSHNSELQHRLLDATLQAKSANPFHPVTLLVDNPLQGTLIRRQLIELSADKSRRAIANFNVVTPIDLIGKLASNIADLSFNEPRTEYLEAVIFSLMNQEQAGDDSEQSMATASAVAKVFRKLQFVSDESIELLKGSNAATATHKYVFGLVQAARKQMDFTNAAKVCSDLISFFSDDHKALLSNQIGTLLNLLSAPANSLLGLLELINTHIKVLTFEQVIELKREPLAKANVVLVTSPDPSLEVSMLTRDLMQSLQSFRADRIAILYPDESEYGNQLRDAIDEAGIHWHGRGRTFSQNSVICKGLDLVLEILAERNSAFSGLDRPRLMRLIENGHISIPDVGIEMGKVRRWIRRQELYADCVLWISVLDDVAENDYDPENSVATELKAFLMAFEDQLRVISTSKNWQELGKSILVLLEMMYAQSELITEGSIEDEAWRRLRSLLLGELAQLEPLLEGVGKFNFVNEVMNLRNMVRTKVGDKAVSHGNLGTGVMVGDIASAAFLTFDKVYLLGATEGLLPTVTKEDPYLPVKLLEVIDEQKMADASIENSVDNVADILNGVTSSASSVVVFRPRGGTKTKLENEPSRFLGSEMNDKRNAANPRIFLAENRDHSYSLDLGSGKLSPINEQDYSQLLEKFIPKEHSTLERSLQAWRNPTYNEYFGNLTIATESQPIWSPENSKPLSSTVIDIFITCPYQFLITNIMGFNSSDRTDLLDDFNPNKFGTYFHKQMEDFVNDCLANGTAPEAGQNWFEGAADVFISDYFMKNLYLFVNRGQAGWNRSFEYHLSQVLRSLPLFFENEPAELRQSPNLAIYKPEFSFGYEGDETDLKIQDEESSETYHIRGAIDRLDVSPDENFAAVMDFKTGSLKKMKAKLQITDAREELATSRKTVQDIIYRRAAMERFKKASDAKVFFVFIPEDGKTGFLHAKFAHDPQDFLMTTLRSIKAAGSSGEFLPATGGLQGDHQYCSVCKAIRVIPVAAEDTKGGPGR